MTPLRQRLIEDIRLRNFSEHTVEAYVRAVARFARHYGRSPEQLDGEQVRRYLLHLVRERKVSWSLYNQTRCALQFFYRVTLGRDEWFDKLPCAKRPVRLPTVLSAGELRRLFDVAAREPKHQALMMTLYGAGLRISEAFALRPADIDSQRMLIHIRSGKGNKQRMAKLSAQLLAVLRDYWRKEHPKEWLFPQANDPSRPMDGGGGCRIVQRFAKLAGITRLLDASVKHDWVVYAKRPFGGPQQVLKYLSRYTHRIAISNRRLVAMDDQTVTFRYKDYAQGSRPRTMTLDGQEFLRRFLLHAVPRGFMHIRHFGLLANRGRAENLAACRRLLDPTHGEPTGGQARVAATDGLGVATWPELPRCPVCEKGRMVPGPRLSPAQVRQIALRLLRLDSS